MQSLPLLDHLIGDDSAAGEDMLYTGEAGSVELGQKLAYQMLGEHHPGRLESFNRLHESP